MSIVKICWHDPFYIIINGFIIFTFNYFKSVWDSFYLCNKEDMKGLSGIIKKSVVSSICETLELQCQLFRSAVPTDVTVAWLLWRLSTVLWVSGLSAGENTCLVLQTLSNAVHMKVIGHTGKFLAMVSDCLINICVCTHRQMLVSASVREAFQCCELWWILTSTNQIAVKWWLLSAKHNIYITLCKVQGIEILGKKKKERNK